MGSLEFSFSANPLISDATNPAYVHGMQIWKYWQGGKLIINVIKMFNPSLIIEKNEVVLDSGVNISWKERSDGPVSGTKIAYVFTYSIDGLEQLKNYDIRVADLPG